jgi:hypothetical protein
MYYESVFRELNKRKVKYLVVGGVAVVLYGVVRLTIDLDLLIDLSTENISKFIGSMESLGYKPKAPVKASDLLDIEKRLEWAEKKNMVVFSFYNTKKSFELVDIFITEQVDFKKAYSEKEIIKAGGLGIPTASLALIKDLKKKSGRPQDLADLDSLKTLEAMADGKKK